MTIQPHVYPGQRVITSHGTVATVAYTLRGVVYVYGPSGLPIPVTVRCDAWGGEHVLLAAA